VDRIDEVGVDAIVDLRWRVLRVGRPRESALLPGDDAPGTRHFACVRDGVVVGCTTVMPQPRGPVAGDPGGPDPAWRLRGMAVDTALQRAGVGRALVRHVRAAVGAPLWCDARLAAVPFYAAQGWRVVSDVYDVPLVGPHHRMVSP
jgi:GNAT superfamily N-acetyltransferase